MNLKKNNIKNRTCYYFDDIMKVEDINVYNNLLEEKSYKNILVYNILYKKIMDAKSLRIRFDKVDLIIKIYNGIRYLELCNSYGINSRIYYAIFDKINYLISEKSGIADSINHNFAIIRIDSYNSLRIEKMSTFHNVIRLIKSVVKMNKNEYYYHIFLEKTSIKNPIHDIFK